MALKIRLQRGGSAHSPVYRVVVAESKYRRDGRFVESLGHYNPQARGKDPLFVIDVQRADHWITMGAQPTETAAQLLKQARKKAAVAA
jgi:small subunit ribosomal protein S16